MDGVIEWLIVMLREISRDMDRSRVDIFMGGNLEISD